MPFHADVGFTIFRYLLIFNGAQEGFAVYDFGFKVWDIAISF